MTPSHEISNLGETWGGSHEISNATGFNLGYWFLRATLSVSPDYDELLCAHYLPANGADSLVDMMDHRKPENPDRLLSSMGG